MSSCVDTDGFLAVPNIQNGDIIGLQHETVQHSPSATLFLYTYSCGNPVFHNSVSSDQLYACHAGRCRYHRGWVVAESMWRGQVWAREKGTGVWRTSIPLQASTASLYVRTIYPGNSSVSNFVQNTTERHSPGVRLQPPSLAVTQRRRLANLALLLTYQPKTGTTNHFPNVPCYNTSSTSVTTITRRAAD